MLKAVVLPDPLGPIRAVIVPCSTSNEQPFTAATPPKCLVRAFTLSRLMAPSLPPGTPGGRPRGPAAPRGQPVADRRDDAPRQEQHDQQEHGGIADQVQL